MARAGSVTAEAEAAPEQVSESTKIFAWRVESLIRAGYDFEAAWLIANSDADIHTAADLLRDGCSISTALLILL